MDPVDVVAAVVSRQGEYLLCLRPDLLNHYSSQNSGEEELKAQLKRCAKSSGCKWK
jgi:hypothetical protein